MLNLLVLLVWVCVCVSADVRAPAPGFMTAWRKEALRAVPDIAVLHAPFTAFSADASQVNVSIVPAMAQTAKSLGVTVIWTCGSMSQFDTMTLDERKALNQAWVTEAHKLGMYVIVHVGTTVQQDAVLLAQHAKSIGADAIASVPPYYEVPSTAAQVIQFLQPIAAAAAPLPLFYYHIPGTTKCTISATDLLTEAATPRPVS